MGENLYTIVFNGEIIPGKSPETVKQNLSAFYKVDLNKIESLFSGKTFVLKKSVTLDFAQSYMLKFEEMGAICSLIKSQSESEVTPPSPPIPSSVPPIVPPAHIEIQNQTSTLAQPPSSPHPSISPIVPPPPIEIQDQNSILTKPPSPPQPSVSTINPPSPTKIQDQSPILPPSPSSLTPISPISPEQEETIEHETLLSQSPEVPNSQMPPFSKYKPMTIPEEEDEAIQLPPINLPPDNTQEPTIHVNLPEESPSTIHTPHIAHPPQFEFKKKTQRSKLPYLIIAAIIVIIALYFLFIPHSGNILSDNPTTSSNSHRVKPKPTSPSTESNSQETAVSFSQDKISDETTQTYNDPLNYYTITLPGGFRKIENFAGKRIQTSFNYGDFANITIIVLPINQKINPPDVMEEKLRGIPEGKIGIHYVNVVPKQSGEVEISGAKGYEILLVKTDRIAHLYGLYPAKNIEVSILIEVIGPESEYNHDMLDVAFKDTFTLL